VTVSNWWIIFPSRQRDGQGESETYAIFHLLIPGYRF
jgi:hypothetical protein